MKRTSRLLEKYSLHVPAPFQPKDSSLIKHLEKDDTAKISVLNNGFRVMTQENGGETATVGVWIDAGSRFETWENNGVAHFLEHMTFKGTKTRSKNDIDCFFELTGGQLNAYTTREQTVYFCDGMKSNVAPAMERITDILRNPKLRDSDLEAERYTILKEKEDVEMSIDEVMMDHVHLTCFPNDGLGMTILGLEENIARNINIKMIEEYIRQHYTAKRMCMVACGGVRHEEMCRLAEAFWGDLPSEPAKPALNATFHGGHKIVEYDLPCPNLTIAWGTCGQSDHDMVTLQVIEHIFGEWQRAAHEQNAESPIFKIADACKSNDGVLETCQAFTTPYNDVSLFGFYLVSAASTAGPEGLKRFQLEVVRRILAVMNDLTDEQLHVAKESYKLRFLMSGDTTTELADVMGAKILAHGRDIPLAEVWGRIDHVSLNCVREVLARYIMEKPFVLTGVGNAIDIPDDSFKHDLWNKDATYQTRAYAKSA
eukprot:TRINITY_DN4311_c0_g1_i10.p1 TRINITY_DN4311_c0_g1~~TRINITY_DN4311_c0_g1_i10.p1  ORF type:complete len:494 (+),score=113.88 TRINITY_DN4311_c0_g1_i10:34-1482(+)